MHRMFGLYKYIHLYALAAVSQEFNDLNNLLALQISFSNQTNLIQFKYLSMYELWR